MNQRVPLVDKHYTQVGSSSMGQWRGLLAAELKQQNSLDPQTKKHRNGTGDPGIEASSYCEWSTCRSLDWSKTLVKNRGVHKEQKGKKFLQKFPWSSLLSGSLFQTSIRAQTVTHIHTTHTNNTQTTHTHTHPLSTEACGELQEQTTDSLSAWGRSSGMLEPAPKKTCRASIPVLAGRRSRAK